MSSRFETCSMRRRDIRKQRRRWIRPNHKSREICSQNKDSAKSVVEQTPDNINIPGFYFDLAKKRYFRLLPGHNNFNPLTTSVIRQRELARTPSKVKEHGTSLKNPSWSKTRLSHPSLAYCLAGRQIGLIPTSTMNTEIMKERLRNLKLRNTFEMLCAPDDPTETCEYLVGSADYGYVVGSWRLEGGGSAVLASVFTTAASLSPDGTARNLERRESEPGTLKMHSSETVNIHFNQKVYDICAVDVSEEFHYALYTAVSYTATRRPYSSINLQPICKVSKQINRCFGEYPFTQTMEFPQSVAWSCTWNKATKSIACGIDEYCMIKQLEQSECKNVYTNKEKPYSVAFNNVGNSLFTGTHKGHLLCSDLREDCTNRVSYSLELGRGISYLKVLEDETTLIASGYDGNLVQVDLRQKLPVLKYKSHINDFGKLPFCVDEYANVLCCTGKDQKTRFWNLRQGELLSDEQLTAFGKEAAATWFSSQWVRSTKTALIAVCNKRVCVYE